MLELKKVDFKEILNLIKESDEEKIFLPSISDNNFSVEKFFIENNKIISLYGSFLNDNLIGFLSLIFDKNNFVSIGPMYISKKFRGQGFGKEQVEKVINRLKQENIKGIKTKTWGDNQVSRNIFEKLGFKLVEEKLNARINGDSTMKYYLELT